MPITFYDPDKYEFYGLRVQCQIDNKIKRRYFSFAGKTPAQREKLTDQAIRLDKKWSKEVRAAEIIRRITKPSHNAKHGSLGITGITMCHAVTTKKGRTYVSLGFRATGGGTLRTIGVNKDRTLDQAWRLAVNRVMEANGYPEQLREEFEKRKPTKRQRRKYVEHMRDNLLIDVSFDHCEKVGWL